MKNLIYLLIFLPSLLFSQETKNMEFVGVRNINISLDESNVPHIGNYEFEVDSNYILKITSISTGINADFNDEIIPRSPNGSDFRVNLNGGCIFYNGLNLSVAYPIFLESGSHTINYYVNGDSGFRYDIILYCQEFNLTSP